MPKVFISHKSAEKPYAEEIRSYLRRCFIKVWLDKNDLPASQNLNNAFLSAIEEGKTIALISKAYMDSEHCMHEFDWSFDVIPEKIIPVLLEPHGDLLAYALEKKLLKMSMILRSHAGVTATSDRVGAIEQIRKAVVSDAHVWFKPLQSLSPDGQALQYSEFEMAPGATLPSDLFQSWDYQMDQFVSISDDDDLPMRRNVPVAFGGRGPAWLYAHLAVPFFNLRDVFIYNNFTNEYICAHARPKSSIKLGTVLKDVSSTD